jgi:hypothetical protein
LYDDKASKNIVDVVSHSKAASRDTVVLNEGYTICLVVLLENQEK